MNFHSSAVQATLMEEFEKFQSSWVLSVWCMSAKITSPWLEPHSRFLAGKRPQSRLELFDRVNIVTIYKRICRAKGKGIPVEVLRVHRIYSSGKPLLPVGLKVLLGPLSRAMKQVIAGHSLHQTTALKLARSTGPLSPPVLLSPTSSSIGQAHPKPGGQGSPGDNIFRD